jgi:predicted amidohydrolase YtcJ
MVMTRLVLPLLLCASLQGAARPEAPLERVFYGGKIFTADPQHPYAEAVAIRGDRIVAVGTRAEASRAVGSGAELIDLKGNFLMPGLIDSHCHAIDGGLSLISANFDQRSSSLDDLAAFTVEAKKSGRGMQGDILIVSGIPLEFWSKTNELNERFNEGPYADQPLLLDGMDGHTAWANKALLQRAEIDRRLIVSLDTVERGYYGVGPDSEPNGFLVDAGKDRVDAVVAAPSSEQMLTAGQAAVRYLHAQGITAWLDPAASEAILATYQKLAERGELKSHVAALPVIDFTQGHPEQQLATVVAWRRRFNTVPGARIIGIKVFADGVLEYPSQTAALSKPYRNSGSNGELLFDPAEFARIAVAADRQGMIVHVHAIGDRAVTEALNGIAAARKANGNSALPHTITHLQLVRPEDMPRFRRLGVIASFQLYWAMAETDAIELVQPYVDSALYAWQYPARSLLDEGAVIAGASDWPVTTANVFFAIYQAETRKGPEGVLDANQRVPREAMLYAYTRNAARALNEQEEIGSIAPGKLADFVLLDRDVLTATAEEARDTRVLWTIVGGETVYGAQPESLVAQAIPDTIAQHLVALEQRWNDAILRNDSALAGTFMAEEWTEITSVGSVLTRTGDLAELVGGYHATALRLSDMAVHVYDDAAVVSGTSEEQSSFRGKDTSSRFRWMDVWVRRSGRWVCVASTVARIASS